MAWALGDYGVNPRWANVSQGFLVLSGCCDVLSSDDCNRPEDLTPPAYNGTKGVDFLFALRFVIQGQGPGVINGYLSWCWRYSPTDQDW